MSDFLLIVNMITLTWLAGFTIRCLLDLGARQRKSSSFVSALFCVLYGIPIGLDVFAGIPEYALTPGLRAGANDEFTCLVYNCFVALVPLMLWYGSPRKIQSHSGFAALETNHLRFLLCMLLIGPLLVVPFAPRPDMYLQYGSIIQESTKSASYEFHGFLAVACLLSMLSGAALLLVNHKLGRTFLLVIPFNLIAIWMQGKRSSVALFFILLWFVAWARGLLRSRMVWAMVPMSALIFSGYIAWYQNTFRPNAVQDSFVTYENSRIDYGRDHHLKAAIFCELSGNEQSILEYRGQSFLFSIAMFIPRTEWPEKPLPYAIYMTGYALQSFSPDRGWGLTTSILDEAVANFGWLGFAFGPAILLAICRVCDRSQDLIVKVLGILIACLFLCVEFVAFAPIFLVWVSYTILSQRRELSVRAPRIGGLAWN